MHIKRHVAAVLLRMQSGRDNKVPCSQQAGPAPLLCDYSEGPRLFLCGLPSSGRTGPLLPWCLMLRSSALLCCPSKASAGAQQSLLAFHLQAMTH